MTHWSLRCTSKGREAERGRAVEVGEKASTQNAAERRTPSVPRANCRMVLVLLNEGAETRTQRLTIATCIDDGEICRLHVDDEAAMSWRLNHSQLRTSFLISVFRPSVARLRSSWHPQKLITSYQPRTQRNNE